MKTTPPHIAITPQIISVFLNVNSHEFISKKIKTLCIERMKNESWNKEYVTRIQGVCIHKEFEPSIKI
jgi:hypothetical protein